MNEVIELIECLLNYVVLCYQNRVANIDLSEINREIVQRKIL